MNLKVNKLALSIATAALMITSILSTVTSASATNEITLTADRNTAKAGERINVTVGYIPNDTGAAGFTINLHYDADKVDVYVPSESEMDSAYNVGSKFSVITNYVSSEGTVKIVGANLSSTNITSKTDIALATFTVKSGVSGKINFWTDIETMVSSSGSGYVNSSYSAPTEKSPLTVSGPSETSAVTSQQTTAVTSVSSSVSKTTTDAKTTVKTSTKKTTTTVKTTTATTAASTASTKTSSKPQTVTSVSSAKPQTTTTVPVVTKPDESVSVSSQENVITEPIYTYKTDDNDFNSEEAVSYSFSLSDYIKDYSQLYNIKVNISTNGNVNGAIGMLVNNSWQSYGNITHETGSDTWTAENIDPNSISGNVFVQLYYLKGNSEFTIDSIEAVPVKAANNLITEDSDGSNSKTDKDSNTDKNGTSSDSSSIGEDSAVSSEAEKTNSSTSSIVQQESNNQAVENAVDHAVQEAEKNSGSSSSDSNPTTGSAAEPIRTIITALCAAEILWSLFVIIFNRVHKKED